jgi:hypothetical protein
LSCFATFGVWPLTFPARASDPCTLPEKIRNISETEEDVKNATKTQELDRGEERFTHGCVLYNSGDKALLGFDGEAAVQTERETLARIIVTLFI